MEGPVGGAVRPGHLRAERARLPPVTTRGPARVSIVETKFSATSSIRHSVCLHSPWVFCGRLRRVFLHRLRVQRVGHRWYACILYPVSRMGENSSVNSCR